MIGKVADEPLEVFRQASRSLLNTSIEDWRRDGGGVVGYFYSYIPEEIITAAGLLPFRIRAAAPPEPRPSQKGQNRLNFLPGFGSS